MKRRDLIRWLWDAGCVLIKHGGKHDWLQNPKTLVAQPMARHAEGTERLALPVLRKMATP